GQQALPLERRSELGVELDQRPGDTLPERTRLPGDPASVEPGEDVELLLPAGHAERLGDDHAMGPGGEVALQRAAVQRELAGPRRARAGRDALPAGEARVADRARPPPVRAGLVGVAFLFGAFGWGFAAGLGWGRPPHGGTSPSASGFGCCARCGCSAPSYTCS